MKNEELISVENYGKSDFNIFTKNNYIYIVLWDISLYKTGILEISWAEEQVNQSHRGGV